MKNLKRARVRRGWTQRELAARAGTKEQYVRHLEAGRKTPSLTLLRKLATVLKVPLAKLVE